MYIIAALCFLSLLFGQSQTAQGEYRQAYAYEKNGEYEKAESLYKALHESYPDHYNYFTHYKLVLSKQKKFNILIPLLEKRIKRRSYDHYLRLELGVLYYAVQQEDKARETWNLVFKEKSISMCKNYANYIYQDIMEYGLGNTFHAMIRELRELTGISDLLVQYYFLTCMRYQDWEHAAKEIKTIIKTQPNNLRYVRQTFFNETPESPLYNLVLEKITDIDSDPARMFLSEIYTYLNDHYSAYKVLSTYPEREEMQKAMITFANRMYKKAEYDISLTAAEWVVFHNQNIMISSTMALLAAQSIEQQFYQYKKSLSFIPMPFSSTFTNIRYSSYDMRYASLIENALQRYDSLLLAPEPINHIARFHRAEITYLVFHDYDRVFSEYMELAENRIPQLHLDILRRIADVYTARGQYQEAVDFLRTAGERYHLMVHEEDRLLPHILYTSLLADEGDSLYGKTVQVLALLPEDDPLYNDILSYAGFISEPVRDTLRYENWLQAERLLVQNKISQASEIFYLLLQKDSPAVAFYGVRYLDCIRLLGNSEAEKHFWDIHYERMINSYHGDFFMIRYAEFLERKMKNLKKAIEIYEKYLLSYQESMYYESIRQYVRELYTTGAQ